jgi:hypothetical protein
MSLLDGLTLQFQLDIVLKLDFVVERPVHFFNVVDRVVGALRVAFIPLRLDVSYVIVCIEALEQVVCHLAPNSFRFSVFSKLIRLLFFFIIALLEEAFDTLAPLGLFFLL